MKNGNGFLLSGSLVCNVHVILVNPFNAADEKKKINHILDL